MGNAKKKEIIHILYDSVFNKKQYEKLSEIISPDYISQNGEKGEAAFQKTITGLSKAFPDAHWEVTEIIADGNKAVVKQKFTGTHKNQFQNIQPTNRAVSTNGIVTYEFTEDKIIGSEVQTDRLGFLQQLGLLPADLSVSSRENKSNVFFVDKFFISKSAVSEFIPRMEYNWDFIKLLPGFIKHEVIVDNDTDGNLILMTIAVWENQEYLDKAKVLVQNEYKKINFNPHEFMEQLNIKMERQMYKPYQQ